jgi:hypothetical protein
MGFPHSPYDAHGVPPVTIISAARNGALRLLHVDAAEVLAISGSAAARV